MLHLSALARCLFLAGLLAMFASLFVSDFASYPPMADITFLQNFPHNCITIKSPIVKCIEAKLLITSEIDAIKGQWGTLFIHHDISEPARVLTHSYNGNKTQLAS